METSDQIHALAILTPGNKSPVTIV